ncbi:MAG: hypothetical protein K2J39_09130 [Ruminococcus sp.]|nr:hypothetical protein [Ruminococcus sp.]
MTSTQEFDVYSTADESYLNDTIHMKFGTFRNNFYKNPVQIRAYPINDYAVSEKSVKLYFIGENQYGLEHELE